MPSAQDIALIRVQLDDAEPAIWRRFAAPVTTTVKGLHDLIQAAMGWQDYHLWEFEFGTHRYGDPDPEYETNPPTQRAAGVKLAALIARDDLTFSYVYDFGEYWHTFERRMPRWDRGWRPSLRAWFARFHKNYGGLGPVDWPRDRFCRD